MTELRERMIRAMQLRNYSPPTQKGYISCIVRLTRHYRRLPNPAKPEPNRFASSSGVADCSFDFANGVAIDEPSLSGAIHHEHGIAFDGIGVAPADREPIFGFLDREALLFSIASQG